MALSSSYQILTNTKEHFLKLQKNVARTAIKIAKTAKEVARTAKTNSRKKFINFYQRTPKNTDEIFD